MIADFSLFAIIFFSPFTFNYIQRSESERENHKTEVIRSNFLINLGLAKIERTQNSPITVIAVQLVAQIKYQIEFLLPLNLIFPFIIFFLCLLNYKKMMCPSARVHNLCMDE
jgi:hypothetical protein